MLPVAPLEVIPAVEPMLSVPPEDTANVPLPEITLVPQLSVAALLTLKVFAEATETFAPRVTVFAFVPLPTVTFCTVEPLVGVKLAEAAPPENVRLFVPVPKLINEVRSPPTVMLVVAEAPLLP